MKARTARTAMALAVLALVGGWAWAHCQIPCGIYDDEARFTLMLEHVTTIEKSMTEIRRLSAEEKPDLNQVVRWVDNKESHADQLAEIVTHYFMAQRLKPVPAEDATAGSAYIRKLTLLHRILVQAMKAKQTTAAEPCVELRTLIADFKTAYLEG